MKNENEGPEMWWKGKFAKKHDMPEDALVPIFPIHNTQNSS